MIERHVSIELGAVEGIGLVRLHFADRRVHGLVVHSLWSICPVLCLLVIDGLHLLLLDDVPLLQCTRRTVRRVKVVGHTVTTAHMLAAQPVTRNMITGR